MSQSLKEIEDDNVLHNMRLDMREQLLKRLLKSNLGGASKGSPQMQAAFAKRLEEVLFKTSKTVGSYSDTKTLDKRLQTLMAAMQKRKTARTSAGASAAGFIKSRASSSSASRTPLEQGKRAALVRILGQDKMVRTFKVVAEIKLIQLGRQVQEGKPYEPFQQCTLSGGCSFAVPCEGEKKAPKVVRDLFFNTAIVAALERTSPELMETLPWDQLLAQGEARLAAYHAWFQQRQEAINETS